MSSASSHPASPDDPQDGTPDAPIYESPDDTRASSASPTESQLERELPGGRDATSGGHDPYAALRYREYRLYAAAFFVSVIGGQTQNVTVGWEIYRRTNSPLSLGWLGLVMATPVLLLALPAGHVADTHSRRRIMLATQSISAACALGLALLSHLYPDSLRAVWGIYALMLVGNSAASFGRPARSALMPQLLPQKIFANAVTWNSSIFETGSMIGPAIGGFVCGVSISAAYLFTFACWIVTMGLVFMLPNPKPPQHRKRSAGFSDLLAGVRFVWTNKLMLGAMTLDMFAVLLGGCAFLLPIFAKMLGGGAFAFGMLRAAPSVGALTMAILIAHAKPFRHAGRTLLISVAGFGCATLIFAMSKNFYLSFAMLLVSGAFDNVSVVIRHTLIQLLTPDEMRGRVSAVNQVFIGSSNEIGGFESGMTAAWLGPVGSVILGGIGTIGVVCGVATIWPQLRKLGSLQDIKPTPQVEPRAFQVLGAAK